MELRNITATGFSFFLLLSSCTHTQEKHAIIIGNSDYKSAELNLKNPVNDAVDLAAHLKDLGFTVTKHHDLNHDQSIIYIRDFYRKISEAGSDALSILYYAGHAVQIADKNVLISPDTDVSSERGILDTGVKLDDVFDLMRITRNRKNIVILDACRTNPLASISVVEYEDGREVQLDGQVKTLDTGLEGVTKQDAPVGSIIAYAAEKGGVAYDGKRRNGTYTHFLLKHIVKHKSVEDVLKLVAHDVLKDTENRKKPQVPWYLSSVPSVESIYFYPPLSKNTATLPDVF